MNDLLYVDRFDLQPDATRSRIWLSGTDSGFKLLEDITVPGGKKVYGERAIPAGRYPLALYESPRFQKSYYTKDDMFLLDRKEWEKLSTYQRSLYHPHKLIWVRNVPNYEYILHHWGNTAADTDGCGIVGSSFGRLGKNSAVLASRAAYVRYYSLVAPLIAKGNQYITYANTFLTPHGTIA